MVPKDDQLRRWVTALTLFAALLLTTALFAQTFSPPRFDQLKRDETFAALKLPPRQVDAIFPQIANTSFDTPDSWGDELRVRRMPLGSTSGLVIQGTKLLCGATGNCQTWVFRNAAGRWISLFDRDAPIADGFAFDRHAHHGVPDLVVETNLSADASAYAVYSYDGRFYRATRCYESPARRSAATTRITQVSCRPLNHASGSGGASPAH